MSNKPVHDDDKPDVPLTLSSRGTCQVYEQLMFGQVDGGGPNSDRGTGQVPIYEQLMIGQVDGGGPNSDSESLDQSLGPRTPHLAYIKCCYNHKLNFQHSVAYPMVYMLSQ